MVCTFYKTKQFISPNQSPVTQGVICYDGVANKSMNSEWERNTFMSICDGQNVIHITKQPDETFEDFISRLTDIQNDITAFINHLRTEI